MFFSPLAILVELQGSSCSFGAFVAGNSERRLCVLQTSNSGSTSKRLLKHRTHMLFYNILTIPKLRRSDRGLYTCRVSSGNKTKQQKVTVTVYGKQVAMALKFDDQSWTFLDDDVSSDRPFIRLKPRRGSVMEVQAGQKAYRISPKLRAFPAPKVIW